MARHQKGDSADGSSQGLKTIEVGGSGGATPHQTPKENIVSTKSVVPEAGEDTSLLVERLRDDISHLKVQLHYLMVENTKLSTQLQCEVDKYTAILMTEREKFAYAQRMSDSLLKIIRPQ